MHGQKDIKKSDSVCMSLEVELLVYVMSVSGLEMASVVGIQRV